MIEVSESSAWRGTQLPTSEMSQKAVILLDGGFVKKKLQKRLRRFPRVQDVVERTDSIMEHEVLAGQVLFRVYYYDAPPLDGNASNPIDSVDLDFSTTKQAVQNRALIEALELEPNFAVRRGTLVHSGWKLGREALKRMGEGEGDKTVTANDLVPHIVQKGVDLRIGLDMAWIALKRIADVLVLVTGDSDFVPVMKFARREGLKVYLDPMGHGVRRELKAHADLVLHV